MKMKAYPTFDLWAKDQSATHRKLISALRRLVKKVSPRLVETVKWGNGCWVGKEYPVIYLYADRDHLQFGFFNGSYLKDPKKLLHGKARYVRHLKVYGASDIDVKVFSRFIREAAKNERQG
ncbi:MAG: DUF1801 domain-containing protein [Bdellovibrionales bacterium]|nr:DUF1801 domain-containing protein [Bdellovibrionales bacterium]